MNTNPTSWQSVLIHNHPMDDYKIMFVIVNEGVEFIDYRNAPYY